MKKLVFMFVAFAAISLASCGGSKGTAPAADSTTTTDSVSADSTSADSTKADSTTATTTDSTAATQTPAAK